MSGCLRTEGETGKKGHRAITLKMYLHMQIQKYRFTIKVEAATVRHFFIAIIKINLAVLIIANTKLAFKLMS